MHVRDMIAVEGMIAQEIVEQAENAAAATFFLP